MHLEPVLAEHLAALRALHPEIRLNEPGYDDAAIIIRASNELSAMFSQSLKVLVGAFNQEKQGVRESARVPQLVMLCRWWAQLQCFAGCTGRTAGYYVA